MGGIQKKSFIFEFLGLFCLILLLGCSSLSPAPAPADISPIQTQTTHEAAPTQISGSPSPGNDWQEEDDSINYQAHLPKDQNNNMESSDGMHLKGFIHKSKKKNPDLNGRLLKIIDWRSNTYILVPLFFHSQNMSENTPEEVPFEALFKIQPFNLEDLFDKPKNILSFYVSPTTYSTWPDGIENEKKCEDSNCSTSDWYYCFNTPESPPPSAHKPPPIRLPGKTK